MDNNFFNEKSHYLFDAIPYEITVKDTTGNYIFCNSIFLINMNLVLGDILNKNTNDIWSEIDCKEILQMDSEVIAKNKAIYYERKLRSKNTKVHWYYI